MLKHDYIAELGSELGFDAVGVTRAAGVESRTLFLDWLESGYAGDMAYLGRHGATRFDPTVLLPGARSIIAVGMNYRPRETELAEAEGPYRVAKYAWGEDYHRILRRLLRRLRTGLRAHEAELRGRICVDTAPFMDKYWARLAGLGWQGKHTNLVSRDYGSWLVLGALVTTADVDRYDDPHADYCGSCTACLDACPTSAFPRPYVLDATRCISYWTIEAKAAEIPAPIRSGLAGWVFGCDICLDVCPWNKFEQPRTHSGFARRDAVAELETGDVKMFSPQRFAAEYSESAIARPGPEGIRRNVHALESGAGETTDEPRC